MLRFPAFIFFYLRQIIKFLKIKNKTNIRRPNDDVIYTRTLTRVRYKPYIILFIYIYIDYLNSYKRLKNIIVGTYNLHFRINTLNISISNSRLTFYSFLSLFYNNIIYCIHLLLHNIFIYIET